jgi:hypothetical protein
MLPTAHPITKLAKTDVTKPHVRPAGGFVPRIAPNHSAHTSVFKEASHLRVIAIIDDFLYQIIIIVPRMAEREEENDGNHFRDTKPDTTTV